MRKAYLSLSNRFDTPCRKGHYKIIALDKKTYDTDYPFIDKTPMDIGHINRGVLMLSIRC